MRRNLLIASVAAAAIWMSACGEPANTNTAPANTNTNTAKTTGGAPTVDSLMAMEKAATEAWSKSDTKWFEEHLSPKFVMYSDGMRMDKAAAIKMIGDGKCDVTKMNLTEPAMHKINDDTYAVTYKGEFEGSCVMGGKTHKLDPVVRAGSIVAREGDKWMAVWHGETPIISPDGAAAKADEKAAPATADKKADTAAPAEKKADAPAAAEKKADTAAAADKKEAAGTDALTADKPAAAAKSANTEALGKMHAAGWEAFRTRDAKWFEEHIADSFVLVDPMGGVHTEKEAVIKHWTEGMKCEGITRTSFTEPVATSISPTVELLTGKGNANGRCEGQPNGDLYQANVYIKDGEAWKLAFMFEAPPRKRA